MYLIHRLISADDGRRTRFDDEKGHLVGGGAWLHAPHAYATAVLKRFGYRPRVPWISYSARREIARLIKPDWRMVEFGSGSSTAWFAKHCSFVHSIESDPDWFLRVQAQTRKLANVRCELRPLESYADLSEYADGSLAFVFIDGQDRSGCARSALREIQRGGYAYLDNSDKQGDLRIAERLLREKASMVRYFVDFVPMSGTPTEGLLVLL